MGAGAIIGGAGLALGAFGQWKQGEDAADAYEYNEEIGKYQADYIRKSAAIELESLKRDVGRFVGRTRAIQGKSGTVPDSGSNADAIARIVEEGDIDAAIIRYRSEASAYLAEKGAQAAADSAANMRLAGGIGAGSTLLSGLGKWDYKRISAPAYSNVPTIRGGEGGGYGF